jgi:hypothetical protein
MPFRVWQNHWFPLSASKTDEHASPLNDESGLYPKMSGIHFYLKAESPGKIGAPINFRCITKTLSLSSE